MNDTDDFVVDPLKSSRPTTSRNVKCGSRESLESKKYTVESDCLLPNADVDKCFICEKDLRRLDEIRKSLHVNQCLDQIESKQVQEKEKQKWATTVDCPICGSPLQPGPYRAAHVKRCGRKHNIKAAKLYELMETQTQVSKVKKDKGLQHTSLPMPTIQPIKAIRNKDEPRTLADEELHLGKAISASLSDEKSSCFQKESSKHRVLPRSQKLHNLSYSLVELEPFSCKCAVFEQIQANFLKKYKVQNIIKRRQKRTRLLLGDLVKCFQKLDRLERLADDLSKISRSGGEITLRSQDNDCIYVHRFILRARSPSLLEKANGEGVILLDEFSSDVLRSYVNFLYTAKIEWADSEREDICKLGALFGPKGLTSLCKTIADTDISIQNETRTETVNNADVMNPLSCGKNTAPVQSSDLSNPEVSLLQANDVKITRSDDINTSSAVFDFEDSYQLTASQLKKLEKDNHSKTESCLRFRSQKIGNINDNQVIQGNHPETKNTPGMKNGLFSRRIMDASLSICSKEGEVIEEDFHSNETVFIKSESQNDEINVKNKQDDSGILESFICPLGPFKNATDLSHCEKSNTVHNRTTPPTSTPVKSAVSFPEDSGKTSNVNEPISGGTNTFMSHSTFSPEANTTCLPSPLPLPNDDPCFYQGLDLDASSICVMDTSPITAEDSICAINETAAKKSRRGSVATNSLHLESPITSEEPLVQQFCSTPISKNTRHRFIKNLDSNTKVLKIFDVTPMPDFEKMSDAELKEELAKYGIRSMGKKRSIAVLKKIYEETHPDIEGLSPICRNTRNVAAVMNEENTLNESLVEEDVLEESCVDDIGTLPKDNESMQTAVLTWLRRDENKDIYIRVLGLNAVPFDQFYERISKSTGTVALISKNNLMEILDRLHITFSLLSGDRRRRRKRY
ncbi:hypothetical protein AB6A40_001708 [Gnathostoma spinigerum]|uniref:BTB domain-containing protein n=1 Tax=Gnathostoma spinigerum TaxID=75299 RepID=A0ABD6E4S9_9BILA